MRTRAWPVLPARWAAFLAGTGLVALAACHDVYVYPIRSTVGGAGGGAGGIGGAGGAGPVTVDCPTSKLRGFATLGPGTTGGGTSAIVVVRTLKDLKDAANRTAPLVVRIDGLIESSDQLDVASDKTIEGVGPRSGLTGAGMRVKDNHNVIFRNLVVAKAVGMDAISLMVASNIWIDHCDLSSDRLNGKSYYDGLIDISHACDNVTVSWTYLHDHFHASLVGHSPDNGAEDIGHLTVTYYDNLFDGTESELPRVRFGKVHVFNNHFRHVPTYAIASQMGADVLVERNVFEDVAHTMLTAYADPEDGRMHQTDNIFLASSAAPEIGASADSTWTPPYRYADDWLPADSVALVVDACAGTGP